MKNHMRNALMMMLSLAILLPATAQIQLLNDEFDDQQTLTNWRNVNEVEGWNVTRLESYNINDSVAGSMFMKPFTGTWFNEYRGALLYKEISGDFVISTRVTATGRDHSSVPGSDYSLAGIMIRTPLHYPINGPTNWMAGQQNFIFMSIGQAVGSGANFEIKNTCNSNSVLDAPSIPTQISEIRMARIGQVIIVLSRFPGGDWEVRDRFDRNDCGALFPDTVQIGMVTYTDWPKVSSVTPGFHNTHTMHLDSLGGDEDPSPAIAFNPDLIGQFDYIRFDSVAVPVPFQGQDLSDPGAVNNTELLTFLGYDTESHCPSQFHVHSNIMGTMTTTQATLITAENMIMPQSNVTYRSTEGTELMPGFEVSANALFQVNIEGCSQ